MVLEAVALRVNGSHCIPPPETDPYRIAVVWKVVGNCLMGWTERRKVRKGKNGLPPTSKRYGRDRRR